MPRHSTLYWRLFTDDQHRDIGLRIKKLGRSLAINVTPHLLRHFRVLQVIEAGVPIERVADIPGIDDLIPFWLHIYNFEAKKQDVQN